MTTLYLDLKDLGLRPGDSLERTYALDMEPVARGGVRHHVLLPDGVSVTVVRVAGGFLVTVGAVVRVYGPCERCLEEASLELHIEQQEFAPTARDGWEGSDLSAFIDELVVDVSGIAREAVVLALPAQLICAESCRGLCPRCGRNLNNGPCDCPAEETDERWGKLRDLKLGGGEGP